MLLCVNKEKEVDNRIYNCVVCLRYFYTEINCKEIEMR